MEEYKLPPIASQPQTKEIEPVHIRFKVEPSALLDSLNETVAEIGADLTKFKVKYLSLLREFEGELVFLPKVEDIEFPVPYVPRENWGIRNKLDLARLQFEDLVREFHHYQSYIYYIRLVEQKGLKLEIEPLTTTFFIAADELEEKLEIDDDEYEEDVFTAAERRQRQLLDRTSSDQVESEDE